MSTRRSLTGFVFLFCCLHAIPSPPGLGSGPDEQSHWFDQCIPSDLSSNFSIACNTHGGETHNRLCLEPQNNSAIGADFSNCNLSSFPSDFPKPAIQFLFLGAANLPPNGTSFCGFINLKFLLLDSRDQCPGEHYSWVVDHVLDSGYRECRDQLEFCRATEQVFSCPSNSQCKFNGPECLACLCKSDYFGYKCMFRRGFPTITFTFVLLGVIIALTGLLWLNRRIRPLVTEPSYSILTPTHND